VDLVYCAFTPGLAMTRSAVLGDDGSFGLSIKIRGQRLNFNRDADGNASVSGVFQSTRAF
jgi:hypothetical protein